METSPSTNTKIAIFASGNGSNAEALLSFAKENNFLSSIQTVVTDQRLAKVIERAESYGVDTAIYPIITKDFATFSDAKHDQELKILSYLKENNISWVLLAGYMRILSASFLDAFYNSEYKINQVVNIHPSLLPNFPGKDGYGDAFKSNVSSSGVTIHFVDAGVDTGPIICQESFERLPTDNLEAFKSRGLLLEHKLYPQILDKIIKGTLFKEVKL